MQGAPIRTRRGLLALLARGRLRLRAAPPDAILGCWLTADGRLELQVKAGLLTKPDYWTR